jgi:hypothetical protein
MEDGLPEMFRLAIDTPPKKSVASCQGSHCTQQGGNLPTALNSRRRVTAVLESVSVTLRCARRGAAVHPAATVLHRRRLTRAAAARPRPAPWRLVHGQVHGVVPLLSMRTLPPGSRRCRCATTASAVIFAAPQPRFNKTSAALTRAASADLGCRII